MTPLARATVIGGGRMGGPIARRLLRAGYDVHLVDVDARVREVAYADGFSVGERLDDTPCDIVVTVLPDVAAFRVVAEPLVDLLRPGALWIDMTSNDPRVAASAAERLPDDVGFVGAPMGGGPSDARDGTLAFYAGGAPESVARATAVLSLLAAPDSIRVAGADIRHGYVMKLLVNTVWFTQVAAVSEAMITAEAHGIDRDRFAELLNSSAARSVFTDVSLPRLVEGDFLADFGLRECVEELDLTEALTRDAGIDPRVLREVATLHREALSRFGPIDGEMLVARYLDERNAG
ncbi:NAD(P)-dependent oxidoreductase [Microbacterium telephonicum]|uniref:3-hydroxyisobutyrate dehydrogenase n=1 Tax=Microbacterium telephonicum TaxID=1714841 RepID=A0A498CHH9_9MICO|nr:NAD(P)-binding domain-containing protein [Microbacterium telephonicum]RLK52550.1 3-hydroxyisobutyrate dehydrogenase [Microbacterium telephonicum]